MKLPSQKIYTKHKSAFALLLQALVCSFFSMSLKATSQDLMTKFKQEQVQIADDSSKLAKLKAMSSLIVCDYAKGWGEIYKIENAVYKIGTNTRGNLELKKVATQGKNGVYKWRERYGDPHNQYTVNWELVTVSANSYKIYMESLGLPITTYSCHP